MSANYITPEVLALLTLPAVVVAAPDVVERGAVRRFAQAIMDPDPIYWDHDAARSAGYRDIVAPPLFPVHAFRPRAEASDPLEELAIDPDFDGSGQELLTSVRLPAIPIPLKRLLNGGNDVEIYSLAEIGDRIVAHSRYIEIFQKQGKDGPMIFVRAESRYEVEADGRLLMINRRMYIWR